MKLNFAKAHKRLWLWLADNPGKYKHDWPEWERNGGKLPCITLYCFPCHAVNNDCDICPITDCYLEYPNWYAYGKSGLFDNQPLHARRLANKEWVGKQVFEI